MPNIGNLIGNVLPFDVTPGFNLSRPWDSQGTTVSSSGTTDPIAYGAVIGAGNLLTGAGSGRVQQPTNNNQKNQSGGNPNQTVLGDSTGGGGSGTQSNWTPQQQALYDFNVAQARKSLGRIPDARETAIGRAKTGYQQGVRSLDQGIENAEGQRDQGITTSQQNFRTAQNQINQTAAQDQQSLLRLLSSMSAGGGSEAQFTFPQLVGENASRQLGGASQTQAGNRQAIDTSFNTFMDEAERRRDMLANQRDQAIRGAQQTAETSRTSLLEQLAELNARRELARGGDVAGSLQPYQNQINTAADRIAELQDFTPRYTGETPDYVAPELSSFRPGESQRIQGDVQRNATGGRAPILDILLGRGREEDRLNTV